MKHMLVLKNVNELDPNPAIIRYLQQKYKDIIVDCQSSVRSWPENVDFSHYMCVNLVSGELCVS